MRLVDKRVLLTGASKGIGLSLARLLLDRGCFVTALSRTAMPFSHDRLSETVLDVSDAASVRAAIGGCKGPVDIVINNAGVMHRGGLLQIDEKAFDDLFDINVRGSWLVLKYAQPLLAPRATIVQMSSRHALHPPLNPAVYGLTKHCALALAQAFAAAYPQHRVTILCPGPVDTDLARKDVSPEDFERKRKIMCSPDELAGQVVETLESERGWLVFNPDTAKHEMR